MPGSTITRIFSLSITTNWLGYILLGGIIFTFGIVQLPDHWYIDEGTLRILGIVLLLVIAIYLWFCAFAKRRHMTIKGQKLVLPSWKFALAQMAISQRELDGDGRHHLLLMGQDVNYFFVLGVLLVSSIAGVIVHIPQASACWRPYSLRCWRANIRRKARLSPPCSHTACFTILFPCCWRWCAI
ncbi:Inner membrane protein YbhQ [Salmonella enterica subsp. enterica]|uniref:Inner membrane protein YbhQ n=1 Tax=Salmonella enterica I TaxID=59201 RepID=A0A379WWT6_SALET|nr:Inner membrane protein YbhQ [Salmonella enterica subsp. enterica]